MEDTDRKARIVRRLLLWGLIVVVIVGLALNKWLSSKGPSRSESAGRAALQSVPVSARTMRYEPLVNRVLTTGTTIADEEVELRAEVAGRITEIHFQEGRRVRKGDLLVKLNDADLQAQWTKAESRKKLAVSNESRQRALFEKQLLSQELYDAALNELQSVEADLQLLKAQIQKTEIRAPFDGVIGLKYVSEGSYISSASRVASLQNLSRVKIDFSVPEKYAGDVVKDSEIGFSIPGSDRTYKGRVYAIEPKIDLATRTVQLRAVCDNPGERLLPGSFANIEVILRRIDRALMVPTEALIPELKGHRVFVCRNGQAVSCPVEIGLRTDTHVQILRGLAESDTLITTGILQLRDGIPVVISRID